MCLMKCNAVSCWNSFQLNSEPLLESSAVIAVISFASVIYPVVAYCHTVYCSMRVKRQWGYFGSPWGMGGWGGFGNGLGGWGGGWNQFGGGWIL